MCPALGTNFQPSFVRSLLEAGGRDLAHQLQCSLCRPLVQEFPEASSGQQSKVKRSRFGRGP